MNINVNVIYSFEAYPQRMADFEVNETVLSSKDRFFTRFVFGLSKKYKQNLTKISFCIYGGGPAIPKDHWYMKCNGKFWDDEIPELMKDLFDVDIHYIPVNK